MTLGKGKLSRPSKTILLVGETGTGKSTLINALFNYCVGVTWEDDVWFQIVEEENGDQRVSQTSDVVVYQIFDGDALPYRLTVINTPGYGDTRGIEWDVIVRDRLLDLFRSEVCEVHAVGLVMKSSECRLSDRLLYVFNSVTSLFGMDLERNIVALLTYSDGVTPKNALSALEGAHIKCARNVKHQPTHFLFNNQQRTERTEDNELGLEHTWRVTKRGMDQFRVFLETTPPQELDETVDVLNERVRLSACIQNLQDQIHLSERLPFLKHIMIEEKRRLLDEAYHHVLRLEWIALNVNSVSTYVHYDFLIENMKEQRDWVKVQRLEEMKRQVEEGNKSALDYVRGKL